MYRADRKRAFQHIASVNGVCRERQKSAKKRIESNTTISYVGRKISTSKGRKTQRKAASQQRTADIITDDNGFCRAKFVNSIETIDFRLEDGVTTDSDIILLPENASFVEPSKSKYRKNDDQQW